MRSGSPIVVLTAVAFLSVIGIAADAPVTPAPYTNNFEQTPLGKPPEDLMILNGEFAVKQVDGNKCLELTADPLDGDGLLFGPAGMTSGTVSARIWAASSGKRFPEFGIGSNDAGGYKLILMPGQGILEIRRGDDSKATAPCPWKTETWTHFRLHVAKLGEGKFQIEGKAWAEGSAEPQNWLVTFQDNERRTARPGIGVGNAVLGKANSL